MLADKLEDILLTMLLLTALLMELEQLAGRANVPFAIGVGVIVIGYAHEQIDNTCSTEVQVPVTRDGKLSVVEVVAVVN